VDDLETLASSRSHASQHEATHTEVTVSALEALKWPLGMLALLIGLPLLYCVLFFSSLDDGHPSGAVAVIVYLGFATPVVAPIGLWASAVAFNRHENVRGRALLAFAVFLAMALGWSFLFRGILTAFGQSSP